MSIDGLFTAKESAIKAPPMKPITAAAQAVGLETISVALASIAVEDIEEMIGRLAPLATASLEVILRNPHKYPSQAVAAAKLVYERKLGAIPDTVVQNNMQFVVKWQD